MTTMQDIRMAIMAARILPPKEKAAANSKIYVMLHMLERRALKGFVPLCDLREVRTLIPDYEPRNK